MPDPTMGGNPINVPQTSIGICPECGHEVMTHHNMTLGYMVYNPHFIPTAIKREATICDNSLLRVEE